MNLAELLAGMREDEDHETAPAMAVELLEEFQKRYSDFLTLCPFKPGELVTPRKDCTVKGAGDPHIVLETRAAQPVFKGKTGTNGDGVRQDMRVANFVGPRVAAFWVESFEFETFSRN